MKNFIQEGCNLELIAPSGGVVAGKVYMIGALLVVALTSAAVGEKFVGVTEGVFKIPKASALVLTAGEVVWHENTTGEAVAVGTSGADFVMGITIEAAGSGQFYALVKLKAI